jgi:transposase
MLNATLRIFALMRLGVNDLEAIAKILDYSVSTVYTYKHRIKSKAIIPPDDFEKLHFCSLFDGLRIWLHVV